MDNTENLFNNYRYRDWLYSLCHLIFIYLILLKRNIISRYRSISLRMTSVM